MRFAKPGYYFHNTRGWLIFDEIGDSAFRGWSKSYSGGGNKKRKIESCSFRDGWNSEFLILMFQAVCALRGRKPWHATYGDVYFTVEVLRRYP